MATFLNGWTAEITLAQEECYKCGTIFAMSADKYRRCKEQGEDFYCPNGHSQVYVKPVVKKMEERLARQIHLTEQAEASRDSWKRTSKYNERSASAYKGVVTKTKKRISNGVCPKCNRHFENVERHMKSKHPDYAEKK